MNDEILTSRVGEERLLGHLDLHFATNREGAVTEPGTFPNGYPKSDLLSLQFGYFQNAVCFSLSSRISDPVLSQHLERRQMAIFLSTH